MKNDKVTAQATLITSQPWYIEFERYVQLAGLAPRSAQVCLNWARQIARHYPDQKVSELKPAKVLDFLIHLQTDRQLKGSTVNQVVSGLRHLYNSHLGLDWDIWKKSKSSAKNQCHTATLPHFLTRPEVDLILGTFRDVRYRAFFTTVYHTGMRLSEATHLKPKHINAERRQQ